jgi:hypothetical protein
MEGKEEELMKERREGIQFMANLPVGAEVCKTVE